MNDQQSRVYDVHCAEVDRQKAQFYNLGANQGDDYITSETDKGWLSSQEHADGTITHEWNLRAT